MKFEFYVLNYDCNKKCVERFNIFRNINVQEWTEKEIRKYLRSPKKYSYKNHRKNEILYGFDALCEEIKHIIQWQENYRREYEISVADAFTYEVADALSDFTRYKDGEITLEEFETLLNKEARINSPLEKWDCYMQCELNIPMIVRECIYQYKQQIKEKNND